MKNNKNFPLESFHFDSNSVLENLPKEEREFFFSKMYIRKIKKGQTLFIEGTYPSNIFFLKRGKIKKYKVAKDGRVQIIYLCTDGELLGYPAVLSEEPYSDSASALEDSTVGLITKNDFFEILDSSPTLLRHLLKNLSHEFAVLENNISMFVHKSIRERLAIVLLILKEKFQDRDEPDKITEIVLTREDLSNIVGIAVETLVRLLHELKDKKVIETKGRMIKVLNPKLLAKIAGY